MGGFFPDFIGGWLTNQGKEKPQLALPIEPARGLQEVLLQGFLVVD